jgi:hypothetical protein
MFVSYTTSLNLQNFKLTVKQSTDIDFIKTTCIECIDQLIIINETLPDPAEMENTVSKLKLMHEQNTLAIAELEEKLATKEKRSTLIPWPLILSFIFIIVPSAVYALHSIGQTIQKVEGSQ